MRGTAVSRQRLQAPIALLVLLAGATPVLAQDDPQGVTATITLASDPGEPPGYDGPAGLFHFDGADHGERYTWTFDLTDPYTVIDVHFSADLFQVERLQQVVPSINISEDHYPLFHFFPRDDLWNADAPAQVFRYIGDSDPRRGVDGGHLRLGLKGPATGTFTLQRDVDPPGFGLGNVTAVDHFSFLQRTTTDELAIGELRIREAGSQTARLHPTPAFAYQQTFPVQGLDPETTYEVDVRFHDWAGNNVTSTVYQVTTTARPVAPEPVIHPIAPVPDATGLAPQITVQARIDAADPESLSNVRLFVDLSEVKDGVHFDGRNLTYGPIHLDDGPHKILVEVYDTYGNRHHRQWTFHVGNDPEASAPGIGPAIALPLLLAWMWRRAG